MSPGAEAISRSSDFVELVREFLAMHNAMSTLFKQHSAETMPFSSLRRLVGDDDESVLFRLKQKSHSLFRSSNLETVAVRREALFDLALGALFHEAMKLREGLYQQEVYAPRVANLRAAAGEDDDALFEEFERILEKSAARLFEGVAEVRILLAQTRDQFRGLLVEREGERGVLRCLLRRRTEVDAAFPEGFLGLLETKYGTLAGGLVEAGHALIDSAYFREGIQVLHEAARAPDAPSGEIAQLERFAEGMQAFLTGDYVESLTAIEAWVDLGGPEDERGFARRASSAISRVDRLVEGDAAGSRISNQAKQLNTRLEQAIGGPEPL